MPVAKTFAVPVVASLAMLGAVFTWTILSSFACVVFTAVVKSVPVAVIAVPVAFASPVLWTSSMLSIFACVVCLAVVKPLLVALLASLLLVTLLVSLVVPGNN